MHISPAGNAAQEAMETAAQTRAEAAHGDSQAARKLARLSVAQPSAQVAAAPVASASQVGPAAAAAPVAQTAPSVPPDSTGTVLNAKA